MRKNEHLFTVRVSHEPPIRGTACDGKHALPKFRWLVGVFRCTVVFVVQCHLDDRRSSATFCVFFSTASIAFFKKITDSNTVEAIQEGPAKI